MGIYCVGCGKDVDARLTDGAEVYPHRPDLRRLPFWKCDGCGNHVGCHHKTRSRTRPLGCIPTAELRNARREIHKVLDPLWQSGSVDRKVLYARVGEHLGRRFHTAQIRSIEEARQVLTFVRRYARSVSP